METLNLGDSELLPNQKTSICEFPDLITTCAARRRPSAATPAYREIAVRRDSRLGRLAEPRRVPLSLRLTLPPNRSDLSGRLPASFAAALLAPTRALCSSSLCSTLLAEF
jgi:hypothetical protein